MTRDLLSLSTGTLDWPASMPLRVMWLDQVKKRFCFRDISSWCSVYVWHLCLDVQPTALTLAGPDPGPVWFCRFWAVPLANRCCWDAGGQNSQWRTCRDDWALCHFTALGLGFYVLRWRLTSFRRTGSALDDITPLPGCISASREIKRTLWMKGGRPPTLLFVW